MVANNGALEKRLWEAADELRANSGLSAQEYSVPVLGLIFLKFADFKFSKVADELEGKSPGRRTVGKADYQAKGVMYLPEESRYLHLINIPEGEDAGAAINDAMRAIEADNEELKDVLPKTYNKFESANLASLLKIFNSISMDIEGDVFGKIYEYFLGKFAMTEGRQGGEFFTPTSIVRLIVEIIEPYKGKIFDPASGSGGMFVQSARFVENHKLNPASQISIYGEEKTAETVRLCKMNLAVHGLSGDVRQGNSYYEDSHKSLGKFDFVMANPPFNVNNIDKERIKDDPRFLYGLPSADNGNYIWIQNFYSALNDNGRAGFVMANSASDAGASEQEIRKKLIQSGAVDVIVSISSNFFYTVSLPVTLWFLDKGKVASDRKNKVLFIDARHIYRQIDRAHRDFKPEQIEFLSNIARLYRGEEIQTDQGSTELMKKSFPDSNYVDVPGSCKIVTINEIKEQGWSLNPGRYVGISEKEAEEFDFTERVVELSNELEALNAEAHILENHIRENAEMLVEESTND